MQKLWLAGLAGLWMSGCTGPEAQKTAGPDDESTDGLGTEGFEDVDDTTDDADDTTDELDPTDADEDGAVAGADCDDLDAARAPDLEEIPYDGIDNDCSSPEGADQVDVDGDGYAGIDQATFLTLTHLRVDGSTANPVWPQGVTADDLDCVDDTSIHPQAASIHPGVATDVAYDGIDADCDGSNDFDVDGDGTIAADQAAAYAAFIVDWDLSFDPDAVISGDCDDEDPSVHPNDPALDDVAMETLGDLVDGDCDGGDSTTSMFHDIRHPIGPIGVVVRPNDHHFLMAVGAEEWPLTPTSTFNRIHVLGYPLDQAPSWQPEPLVDLPLGTSNTVDTKLSPSLDLEADGDRLAVSYAHLTVGGSGVSGTNLLNRQYALSTNLGFPYQLDVGDTSTGTQSLPSHTNGLLDIDARMESLVDDTALWIVGCGEGRGVVSHVPSTQSLKPLLGSSDPPLTRALSVDDQESLSGTICFLDETVAEEPQAVFCELEGCASYDITVTDTHLTMALAATQPWADLSPLSIDQHGQTLVIRELVEGEQVATLITETESLVLFGGESVTAADVFLTDDALYAVGTQSGAILLEWAELDGGPLEGLTTQTASFDTDAISADFAASDVSVAAANGRVFLAVTGTDTVTDEGHLAWAVLADGLAP